MTDRYINPTIGVNGGAGTLAAPWKDLEYALEGNRCTEGDTIYLIDGDYSNIFIDKDTSNQDITLSMAANSGAVTTIMPYNGATITISLPTNVSSGYFLKNTLYNLKFQQVNFDNPLNKSTNIIYQQSSTADISCVFEDCKIDRGTSTSNFFFLTTDTGSISRQNKIRFERCVGVNLPNTIGSTQDQTRDIFTVEIYSCDLELSGNQKWMIHYQNSIFKINNNNFKFLSASQCVISAENSNNLLQFKNNRVDRGAQTLPPIIQTNDAAETYFTANPNSWDVENNVFWDDYTTANVPTAVSFFWGHASDGTYTKQMVMDKSNVAIDLTSINSYGWGDASVRPSKALLLSSGYPVYGGEDWFSIGDVGCYKNIIGRKANYNKINTLMFFGDSISEGATNIDWWNTNATNGITAIKNGTDNPGAIGGIGYRELMTLIDWNALNYFPEWAVLCIGVNNLDSSGSREPQGLTNQRLADQIVELMRRLQYWGIKPIWLGIPSLKGDSGGVTVPQSVNAIVEPVCKNNGWIYGNVINYMIAKNASWQTVYYDAYATDVHPNTTGRQVMAEYALHLVNEARSAGATYGVAKKVMVSSGYSRNFH